MEELIEQLALEGMPKNLIIGTYYYFVSFF
jgi:hypothetical protein